MEVIGIGLARTGNFSLRKGLEQLGYTCLQANSSLEQPDPEGWLQLFLNAYEAKLQGDTNQCKDYLRQALEKGPVKYNACVDHPYCDFYEELMEMYPDAVFIYTIYDRNSDMEDQGLESNNSPASRWAKTYSSDRDLIFLFYDKALSRFVKMLPVPKNACQFPKYIFKRTRGPGRDYICPDSTKDIDWLKKFYIFHDSDVKELVDCKRITTNPNLQFLEFCVKTDGWAPLCRILNKPIPNSPNSSIPHLNEAYRRRNIVNRVKVLIILVNLSVFCGVVALYYGHIRTFLCLFMSIFVYKLIFKFYFLVWIRKIIEWLE